MHKKELVSVIIPTYRRASKIEQALESVFLQTYQNIEVIVVDDNANFPDEREKTFSIVKKFKNVRLIQNEKNLGGALARNVGINAASGKYIAFLDDDDVYKPDKIEKQYELFCRTQDSGVGLVVSNIYGSKLPKNNKELLYKQMMKHIALTSTWFTTKEILEDVGYFENSPSEQDAILLLKIIAKGYNIYAVYEKLVVFVDHEDEESISGHKVKNIIGLENFRSWCRKYYRILNNKNMENNVEYQLSLRLLNLDLINNLRSKAFIEFKNLFKRKPFNKSTYKSAVKIILPSTSIWMERKNKK